MGILIQLTCAEVECLFSHVPVGSHLGHKLAKSQLTESAHARPIGFSNTVQFTIDEARELLHIAKEHCYPDAIKEIQRSMNLCGVKTYGP